LIRAENRDVDVGVYARFEAKKWIDRPSARDAPRATKVAHDLRARLIASFTS
jgi:hypothetical protein